MNSFGTLFRVSVFGESHGPSIGVVIDGCPPGITVRPEDFLNDLKRRQSGSRGTTARHEPDLPEILSGIREGTTTGSPLTIITRNSDKRSSDYDLFKSIPRPGHADFTAGVKYSGFADLRGSGHFSGRITWGLVVAGVIGRKICPGIDIVAKLISAGGSEDIENALNKAMEDNDTIGGIIECTVKNPPLALGEPFFYSFESAVSHIVFSIPAIKGIEFGSGFASAAMRGSRNNDPFVDTRGRTASNNAGGINGGITNGNDIIFRVAVKPTSSTGVEQTTMNFSTGKMEKLQVKGRHDTCIALRMPVIIEAVTAITIADLSLIDRGIYGIRE
ncbi:MAG TPA: chorismate synthase [Bacteroidales bacterium]|jgi:chorismate synthase|nr:chorismate synthase [Bacteroidales bacterium]OQB63754.1 MAG: Chorismate synthase [Bacteroidetes bacterium ADurb.Bin145]HOU01368.1 chorismate synthase [Bacteroidales bacterium]HQG63137.1 chorismate synthase [Bacteroidales bacterium]HQK67451.1 chorismate synthase [Bacteroidales bacterium]